MRAALSILGLVIVFAIVMINLKHQAQQLLPAHAAAGASAAGTGLVRPDDVKRQVQESADLAASRASDAMP